MTRPAEREERFADWVDGRMSARERQRFEAELRVNDDLRRRAEEYCKTVEIVRRALAEPEETVDLADRVMAALPKRRAGARLLHGRFGPALASAAAAAVLIGAFLFLNEWDTSTVPDAGLTRSARTENGAPRTDEAGAVSDADRLGGSKDGRAGFAAKGGFDDRVTRPAQTAAGEAQTIQQVEVDDKAVEARGLAAQSLNRRDLQLVLDELRKAQPEDPVEQERSLGVMQRRQRQAPAEEPQAEPVAGRGGAAPGAPATAKAPPEVTAGERKEQRAAEPPDREAAAREELAEQLKRQTARLEQQQREQEVTPEPQIQVLTIDELAQAPQGTGVDTGTVTSLGSFTIERALPVVTVNVDPERFRSAPQTRAFNEPAQAAEDFFMGNQRAVPRALELSQGRLSAFFEDNALAVQAPNHAFQAYARDRDEAPQKAEYDAAAGIVQLQELPQQWIQFGAQAVPDQQAQLLARSYLVQGTEPAVRGMLSNLRLWAYEENRAALEVGQVAEAEVTQALYALQTQGVWSAPDAGEPAAELGDEANKKAAQQEQVAVPTPSPAGPTTPGPGAAEGRRDAARGRGGQPPLPPAEPTQEDSAVLRRILLVFQEQPAPKPGEAGKSK